MYNNQHVGTSTRAKLVDSLVQLSSSVPPPRSHLNKQVSLPIGWRLPFVSKVVSWQHSFCDAVWQDREVLAHCRWRERERKRSKSYCLLVLMVRAFNRSTIAFTIRLYHLGGRWQRGEERSRAEESGSSRSHSRRNYSKRISPTETIH